MDRVRVNRARYAILVVFSALAACILIAPLSLPSSSVHDLSGTVGVVDNQNTIDQMNPFAQAVYLIGDWNCHQISSRSFYLNGNEMPVCARDMGILLGAIAGMVVAIAFDPKFRWIYLVIGLIPMAIDGGVQLATSYESTNEIRLITGAMAGIVASLLLSHLAWTSLSVNKNERKG